MNLTRYLITQSRASSWLLTTKASSLQRSKRLKLSLSSLRFKVQILEKCLRSLIQQMKLRIHWKRYLARFRRLRRVLKVVWIVLKLSLGYRMIRKQWIVNQSLIKQLNLGLKMLNLIGWHNRLKSILRTTVNFRLIRTLAKLMHRDRKH